MEKKILQVKGIHHISAIASDPRQTVEFYTKVLGLRLVKKTVNQDDVGAYHLFFGDKLGEPGMDLTFFVFKPVVKGEAGVGQVTKVSLAVDVGALEFWSERLKGRGGVKETREWGKRCLEFRDPDGLVLELVGVEGQELEAGSRQVWTGSGVSEQEAIRYFYGAQLMVERMELIEPVLEGMGYEIAGNEQGESGFRLRGEGDRAVWLSVKENRTDWGRMGAGCVHHIAFEVKSEEEQMEFGQKLMAMGLRPTEVINRYYFKSIYFRTPAGILFEIATSGPGFSVDEDEAHLGERLALPPFLEGEREEIEAGLMLLEEHV